tara:strand:- start:534 stop:1436 length:903 start_codon:yes stop_codon:yes gene_type:complete
MIRLPSGVDKKNLIEDLKILSWEACDVLLHYAKILKNSKVKDNILRNDNIEDPVTIADLKVNDLIINRLNEKYGNVDWAILSEENAKSSNIKCDINNDWLWILDPLDGTRDFIQCTGNYAMHLALSYKKKPLIGIVLIPEKDQLWIANGDKVWCESRDGSKLKSKISNKKILQEMVVVTSKNHRNENLRKLLENLNCREIIVMGSIGCKIASIISGRSDIYFSLSLPGKSCPKDWDFAAPEAILKGSGGTITNLDNEELTYFQRDFKQEGIIVASNSKENHKDICLQIKEIIKRNNILSL